MARGKSLIENVFVLALLGILAGGLGGLAIGLVTSSHGSSATAPSAASGK